MTSTKQVTVKELLNELEKEANSDNTFISINHNNKNTRYKTIKNREDLREYFGREITKLFYVKDKNGAIYYNVSIKPDIKDFQKNLKSFNLNKSNDFIGKDGKDHGEIYKITPKNKETTIRKLINEMKTIPDENLLINIESSELGDTDYKDINNIPEEYLNLEITGGYTLFGKRYTYIVITGFTPKQRQTA